MIPVTDPMMHIINDAYTHLIHDVQCMLSSDLYAQWHYAQTLFDFSSDNIKRILDQCPTATAVATAAGWERMGRKVDVSADPILIVAPRIRSPTGTDTGTVFANQKLPPVPVEVYDISQTQGLPLPRLAETLTEDDDFCKNVFWHLTPLAEVPVEVTKDLPANVCGRNRKNKIMINEDIPAAHACMLMVYWIAQRRNTGDPITRITSVQSHAVAYIVLRCISIDTSKHSIGAITMYASGGIADLEESEDYIKETAYGILKDLGVQIGVHPQGGG